MSGVVILTGTISGGNFPHQLSMLRKLRRGGFKMPDLCMGSSGGNFAIYLTMAAGWCPDGIERMASLLDPKFFIKKWYEWLDYMPNMFEIATGYFKGTFYQSSEQSVELFSKFFAPGQISEVEMWVGAVNELTGGVCLFCNKDRDSAMIKGDHYVRRMFKSEPLQYLCGDVELICRASVASSSVPLVIESQHINTASCQSYGSVHGNYVDGGVKFASPLTPLQDEIKEIAKQHDNKIHIVYLSGYDVEDDLPVDEVRTMKQKGTATSDSVVRGFVLHDRMTGYQIIKEVSSYCPGGIEVCTNEKTKINYAEVTSCGIAEVEARLRHSQCSFFEIYPLNKEVLDYTNFKGCDVVRMMDDTDTLMAGRAYWVGDKDLLMGIHGVMCAIHK